MLRSLFKRSEKSPDAAFWEWFEANSDKLLEFENDQESIFNQLSRQLKGIHPDLTFEFGPKTETGRDFVISCDGFSDSISRVERLAEAAPQLESWNFIKFRPRREVTSEIEYEDTKLLTSQIWFKLEPDREKEGKIALNLHIGECDHVNAMPVIGCCFLLLDNALGEYDVMTKLGVIEWFPLPPDKTGLNLKPFTDLPGEFDALYAMMHGY